MSNTSMYDDDDMAGIIARTETLEEDVIHLRAALDQSETDIGSLNLDCSELKTKLSALDTKLTTVLIVSLCLGFVFSFAVAVYAVTVIFFSGII